MSSSPAPAATRFEVVDGRLVDHTTQLVWQGLSETAGLPLPVSPQLGAWRVATGNELTGLLGLLPKGTVSTASDAYRALSFFAASEPKNVACAFASSVNCFVGWWNDIGVVDGSATYNLAAYQYSPIVGQNGYVDLQSTTTLGSYTQRNCAPFCDAGYGFFTVRAIPEPAGLAMWLMGLCLLAARFIWTRPLRSALLSMLATLTIVPFEEHPWPR